MRVDGFFVNQRFACMLCGLGFDALVAHDFANQQSRGLTTYIRQVFKNFLIAKTYTFQIRLKEKTFTVDAYFISIANSNQFGNHFTIAPMASLSDGLLDIVIITEQSKIGMLYNTMVQVGGLNKLKTPEKIDKTRGIIYFQTDKININNLSNAPMHIDGDPVETEKEITASIKPKCFSLLVNKNELT
jgi:diacylglycerol kinase family enzyme